MAITYDTLADRCNSRIGSYSNNDMEWVRFVKDHRKKILESCTTLSITLEEAHRYRYSLTLLMEDKTIDKSLMWIILWINQLGSALEFYGVTDLLIPNTDVLANLKSQYKSSKQTESE
jgi:hypothetical protein